MSVMLDTPLDDDEAIEWLDDRNAPVSRKIAAAMWLTREEGLNSSEIAKRCELSASTLRHMRRLGDKLDSKVLDKLVTRPRGIGMGHVKALVTLARSAQLAMLDRCIAGGWSVRRLEAVVRNDIQLDQGHFARLSELVSTQLGHPVSIAPKGGASAGKMTLEYRSLDEFDALMARLKVDLSEL